MQYAPRSSLIFIKCHDRLHCTIRCIGTDIVPSCAICSFASLSPLHIFWTSIGLGLPNMDNRSVSNTEITPIGFVPFLGLCDTKHNDSIPIGWLTTGYLLPALAERFPLAAPNSESRQRRFPDFALAHRSLFPLAESAISAPSRFPLDREEDHFCELHLYVT